MKKIFSWTPSFISIAGSIFANNTATQGKGGAIAVISEQDIYEFISVSVSDTIFDSNFAALGGGSIYRVTSQSAYDLNHTHMSVVELNNVQIYDSIAKNTYGGTIMNELNSTLSDGLMFGNAFVMINTTINRTTTAGTFDLNANLTGNITFNSEYDGYGGAIYAKRSNVFISESTISNGYAWNGGCLWVFDTALTLYKSSITDCHASHNGGGLAAIEYTRYPLYDLCLAAYYTNFLRNYAINDGGGAWLELHGDQTDTLNGGRPSCVKVFDVNFVYNIAEEGEGNSVYLDVADGDHPLLDGDAPFSVVCDGQDCIEAGSTLGVFCASTILAECERYSSLDNKNYSTCADCDINEDYIPNVLIEDIPGASVTFYVMGWDAFQNRLNTTEYDISVSAGSKATIITPEGTAATDKRYYIVPLIINIGEKDDVSNITLTDQNGVAKSLQITLRIKECDPGYEKITNAINSELFSCNLCDADQYSLKSEQCKSCEQGMFCYGGNNIKVFENNYAKQEIHNQTRNDIWREWKYGDEAQRRRLQSDDDFKADEDGLGSYVTTALCAPGYCCNSPGGCFFNDTDNLCAKNRDPNTVLCGSCLPGFSETLSSSGVCSTCENSNEWLIAFVILGGFGAIGFFYFMGKRERTVAHPFMTYCSKTLLFFYQCITFLTFRSTSQILRPLAELANLNWDVSEDGTCLFKSTTSIQKLWFNLLTPALIICDMLAFYVFIRIRARRKKIDAPTEEERVALKEKWLEVENIAFESAMWAMFLIVYVQITTAFIKLTLCWPFGDAHSGDRRWYMWYAGDVECPNGGQIFAAFVSFFLVFCVPYGMLRWMKHYRDNNENYDKILASLILSYRDQCWYYSAFNIFRRAILIVLPLIPIDDLSIRASFITFTVGLLLAVHCYLMPFKWSANNHLETFVLIISFGISTLNIVDSPPGWVEYVTAVLALSAFVPCIVLFHDFAKLKAVSVAEKLPELSFVWESSEERRYAVTGQSGSSISGERTDGRTGSLGAKPTDGEGGVEMTVPKKDDGLIQRTATSNVPTTIGDEEENEAEYEEKKNNADASVPAQTGLIEADLEAQEDNLLTAIPFFGGRKLKVFGRKRTGTEAKEEEEEQPDEEDAEFQAFLQSTKTQRNRRKNSVFEKEMIRETKFGAERAWLPGSAPAWVNRLVWNVRYNDMVELDQERERHSSAVVPLHQGQDSRNNQDVQLQMAGDREARDVVHELATQEFDAVAGDLYDESVTIRTSTQWTEHGGVVLLPPVDDDANEEHGASSGAGKRRNFRQNSGLQTGLTHLSDFSDDDAPDSDSTGRGLRGLKKSRMRVTAQSTSFNVIKIRQKGWKLVGSELKPNPHDDLQMIWNQSVDNEEQEEEAKKDVANKDDEKEFGDEIEEPVNPPEAGDSTVQLLVEAETEQSGVQKPKREATVDDLMQDTDITTFLPTGNTSSGVQEYEVPNEYKYVDGFYAPKIFDEKFRSLVYCHNKNPDLEMRILSHDTSAADGVSVRSVWIIVDLKKKTVLYQSEKGVSLLKPPTKGWKRLLDEDSYHAADGDDLDSEILKRELKFGFVPAPEIVGVSCSAPEAISVEYDYKKLTIPQAPNVQQWLEIVAHNLTYPETDEIVKVIYIGSSEEKKDEEEKKEDDGLSSAERAYKLFEEHAQIAGVDGVKFRKLDWIRTKFELGELGLEQKYKFTVKLSNCITFAESVLSESIMPMTLPEAGSVSAVRLDAYKQTMLIHYEYGKKAYENQSMNPMTFNLCITPWPGADAFNDENNYFMIDDDAKKITVAHSATLKGQVYTFEPVLVSNVIFGQEYSIVLEAENAIGITESKAVKSVPVRVPPKPVIDSIETDDKEWKMTINVSCPGYNDNDCRGWYELELIDPGDDVVSDIDTEQEQKLSILTETDDDGYVVDEDERKDKNLSYEERLDPGIVEALRTKHKESPIVVSPVFAGQKYIVRVKCVNICASTESDPYHTIQLETPPPRPVFTKTGAFDESVQLAYDCPNYRYYKGYAPVFEIQSTPGIRSLTTTRDVTKAIDGLRNSWDYTFRIRATNRLGTSEWSNPVKLKALKKPEQPTELRTVSGHKVITVLWLSRDKVEEPDIAAKFVVISDPPTVKLTTRKKENRVEFQALDNDTHYRFKVTAVNDNFRIESDWTAQTKPAANKEKSAYKTEVETVTEDIQKVRRKIDLAKKNKERRTTKMSVGGSGTPRTPHSPKKSFGTPKTSTPGKSKGSVGKFPKTYSD